MGRTFLQQETQIRASLVADRTDNVAPTEANFETNATSLLDDINNISSQLSNLLDGQAGDWYDDLNTPVTLDTGAQRGVNDLNSALHLLEKKRIIRNVHNLTDITVPATQNYVVLGTGELPAQTTAARGTTTTLGTIYAPHTGPFSTAHSLAQELGSNALNPKNLLVIVDGSTRDPILSDNRQVFGLLTGEGGVTDGGTITDTTTTRVQINFVRQNATGDALEAAPVGDVQNLVINYCSRERVRLEDLNEMDFLRGAIVDVGAGVGNLTLQAAVDQQGTTPVDVTTNIDIDLEGPGLEWCWRDDLQADMFCIIEGSAGGTSEVAVGAAVDTFNVDAAVNDFAEGATFDSGGTAIDVGVTAGRINATALELQASTGVLRLDAATSLRFDDGNQTGSTWAQAFGITLSNSTAEWDAFETAFGETSLLDAIVQAQGGAATKTCATVTQNESADTDIGGTGGGLNLDGQIHDISGGDFVGDHDVYWNGQLLRGGATSGTNNDYYPGTSLALGQIKLEFKAKTNDVLCIISRA